MIPTPPPDAGLPALPTLLDGDAVAVFVAGAIGVEATACVPRYVRYKPGTSCVVHYHLSMREADGRETMWPMHIKTHADTRGRRRVTNRKTARLLETSTALHGALPFPRALWLPEIGGHLELYPVDYSLRYLPSAASAAAMTAALREAWPEHGNLTVVGTPELVRYKPERKAMLRYELAHGPVARLYGKVRVGAPVPLLVEQTEALRAAGVATPRIVHTRPDLGFAMQEGVAGTSLAALRGTHRFTDWMEPVADALARVHAVDAPGPAFRLIDAAIEVAAGGAWLERIVPHLAARIRTASDRAWSALTALDERVVTVHGDFYDDQALVSDAGVTIIDLDELRRGHPLLDVGTMLAHLTAAAARGDGSIAAREAFLQAALSRQHDAREIAIFEAAALLKLAPGPFRRLEEDWPDGIERILALVEARLSTALGTPVRSTVPWRVVDAALPQLATLQDGGAMTHRISDLLDDAPVSVAAVETIRHKSGRRAILRYEVEQHGCRATLFAKTFASERGPRVCEITRAITRARAFGEDVALPDPVGYLPELRTLVQRCVAGESIEPALGRGDTMHAGPIADALHRFHTCGLDLVRFHDLATELWPLPRRVAQVAAACPELGGLARACLERTREQDHGAFAWRYRPVHRDFYHDQVLIAGERLAVLDLDDASMSEPAVDIANFAAHLMLLGAQRRGDADVLAPVSNAFLDRYRALDPELDDDLVRFLTVTTLLRLAGIHISRTNGLDVARALLTRAAEMLRVEATLGAGC